MPIFRSSSPVSLKKLCVGFGSCDAFNRSIDKFIDRDKFQYEVLAFKQHKNFRRFDFVVPVTVGEVLHLRIKHPKLNFRKFVVPEPQIAVLADDKSRFNAFMQQNGFGKYLPNSNVSQPFPFVVKRNKDSGGQHTFLIRDQHDQQRWQHLLEDDEYFVQQYIAGDIEYTTHLLYVEGIQYSCTIEFRMNRDFYIRGVRMQPFKNVQMSIIPTPFAEIFDRILSTLGFAGVCCFNYKIVDDLPVIFELNPRFGGSLPRDINNFLKAMQAVLK